MPHHDRATPHPTYLDSYQAASIPQQRLRPALLSRRVANRHSSIPEHRHHRAVYDGILIFRHEIFNSSFRFSLSPFSLHPLKVARAWRSALYSPTLRQSISRQRPSAREDATLTFPRTLRRELCHALEIVSRSNSPTNARPYDP